MLLTEKDPKIPAQAYGQELVIHADKAQTYLHTAYMGLRAEMDCTPTRERCLHAAVCARLWTGDNHRSAKPEQTGYAKGRL
ncbi:MAG: hypothetical protein RRZ24_09835 [Clostridia bacterium]